MTTSFIPGKRGITRNDSIKTFVGIKMAFKESQIFAVTENKYNIVSKKKKTKRNAD